MKFADTLKVETPGERDLVVTRIFDAPRTLVFDAFTKPELVSRWNYGPDQWQVAVCEIDLRVGGAYRYVWRDADGAEIGMGGVYREVVAPERLVFTGLFDIDWTGGETLTTTVFVEREGRTTVKTAIRYASAEARAAVLRSPMMEGWTRSYERLDTLIAAGVRR